MSMADNNDYSTDQQHANNSPDRISLLWPSAYRNHSLVFNTISEDVIRDLELGDVFLEIIGKKKFTRDLNNILTQLCDDPVVIEYRQHVFEDLMNHPELVAGLEKILPDIETLTEVQMPFKDDRPPLYEALNRIAELESYVRCMDILKNVFLKLQADFKADGFRLLKNRVSKITASEDYNNLVSVLPSIGLEIRSINSVNIGVNLDSQLRPVEATLIAINKERYTGGSTNLIGRLLRNRDNDFSGIAPLHQPPLKEAKNIHLSLDPEVHGYPLNPMLVPLFKDLAKILKKISIPVIDILKKYLIFDTEIFAGLKGEIIFYLKSLQLMNRLKEAGLPLCKPQIAPREERVFEVYDSCNISLAIKMLKKDGQQSLKERMVLNDISMNEQGRILIITGPNSGGKTVFLQTLGLNQLLGQAGLFIPGTHAKISPVDNIFTHFQVEENHDRDTGRLGEEARRFLEIFGKVTPNSLILMNESLFSTNSGESIYIAEDLLIIIKLLGARAAYSTHLHELAEKVESLNQNAKGASLLINLVASVADEPDHSGQHRRTYKIIPSSPKGHSYAQEVANAYGISYSQLKKLLETRQVISPEN